MTEEKEPFDSWLKVTPPPASDEAKKSAITRGMDAFDQHFSKQHQGSAKPSRLMEAIHTFHHSLFGDNPMKKTQFIGGLCTIALGVALLSSSSLTSLIPQESPVNSTLAPSNLKSRAEQQTPAKNSHSLTSSDLPTPPVAKPTSSLAAQLQPAPAGKEEAKKKADLSDGEALDSVLKNVSAKDESVAKDKLAPQQRLAEKALATPMAPPPPAMLAAPMPIGAGGAVNSMAANRIDSGATDFAGAAIMQAPADAMNHNYHDEGRDKFEHVKDNSVKVVKEEPVSTFSIDVDTSAYSFMRASLNNNVLPQRDSVRVEEFINYFPYEYSAPEDKEVPFKANVAVLPTPWNSKTKLIHIGIKGYQIEQKEKPHSNLVFLIDTSGSMNEPNKLPLLKNSLKLLLDSLKEDDTVGIVTYAGNAGVALEPTPVKEKNKILAAIESFNAGGSTAGAEGIRQAYQLAEKNLTKQGVNRVILATDGDFNVGITDQNELKSYIERERNSGVFLSVLGFGMGNYNDAMMQTLAQNGNGNAAYIDNLSEARKALVEEASSTLFTIAKDVKIQVEFNPAKVAEYRLIGYETRMLNREDFNNDKVDAGDIGSGHTVTALYEITPTGSDAKLVDELRYQQKAENKEEAKKDAPASGEYAFVKIRYKLPTSDTSTLITTPVDGKVESTELGAAPQEARFAAAVAAYAQLLRGEAFMQSYSYDEVITLAQTAKGADTFGYRAEFINLVRLAAHATKLPTLQQGGGGGVITYPIPMTE